MNKLGDFIKKNREKKGLSLRELASLCDLSHSYIDSIEKNKDPRSGKPVSPTVETLGKIAKGVGVPTIELIKFIDPDAYTEAMGMAESGNVYIIEDERIPGRAFVEMEDGWEEDGLTPEDIKQIVNNYRFTNKLINSRKKSNKDPQ